MKVKKNRFVKILVIVAIFFCTFSYSFAVVMSDEKLDEAIEKYKTDLQNAAASSENTTVDMTDIKRENNEIIIESEKGPHSFAYDFSNECKFYKDVEFTKDMTFEEAQENMEDVFWPLIGFGIVAVDKGCNAEDTMIYLLYSLLQESTTEPNSQIENATNGLEYGKLYYQNATTLNNALFTMELEKLTETDEKIVLRTNVIINMDGDFTKVDGIKEEYVNQLETTLGVSGKTNQGQKELPKAGIDIEKLELLKITACILATSIVLVGGSLIAKESRK